ncbi:hypothetical protein [Maribacter sp. 2307UL18-2]|uniref:hypothetical protein n=1 Tax=Maribacter sp. 2307UL18-2 TaxID=3386274 RepID=UPI0039BC91DC
MKFFFLSILFFYGIVSVAQTSLVEELHAMQTRPILKEKVYVHTNKTTYFSDDVIWFKAYVGDSLNYPSAETRKLNVHLIDRDGINIFGRDVLIEEGVGLGQFELDNSVAAGTYYLQARTKYMRNFGQDYHYLQKIKILGQVPAQNIQEGVSYDVQFLPEGGTLVEDLENNMGIKALKNGQGIDFTGTIFNEQDEMVSTFQSENAGMGSFPLRYEKNQRYRAKLQLQDTILDVTLPQAAPQGIALQVDITDPVDLRVYLKTNEATFYNQIYSNYSILFHQDRQLIDLVSIARLDSLAGLISLRKERFLEGVNTVTLFADKQPIAERRFYIETDRKKVAVALKKSIENNDSTTYHLSLSAREPPSNTNLSVSVVTEPSLLLNQENTIESAFLLKPYVRGRIEKPAYYFDPKNPNRKSHLDLLLRTQGWTKYNLDEWIQSINPAEEYSFEQGFELRGTIKDDARHKNLALIPNNFRITDKVKLKGQSNFIFQDLKIFKGDTVRVAYQNWLGKIIKPSNIAYDTIEKKRVTKFLVPNSTEELKVEMKTTTISNKINTDNMEMGDNLESENNKGTIELDEVTVSEKKRDERSLQRRKVIEKYKPLVRDIGKYLDLPIPELSNKRNRSLMDFLREKGYTLITSNSSANYLQGTKSFGVLFINGRYIQPEELLGSLQLQMKDIANVMVHNTSILRPKRRINLGYFQVFTNENSSRLFDRFIVKNGFDRPKKYYTPFHEFVRPIRMDIKEIDWKPFLRTDKTGEVFFKIENQPTNSKLVLSIQGFSSKGHLISKTIRTD